MAPGLTTRSQKLLVTKGIVTRSKDANVVLPRFFLFYFVCRSTCTSRPDICVMATVHACHVMFDV